MPKCSTCQKEVAVWGFTCDLNCYNHYYTYLGLIGPFVMDSLTPPLDMHLQPWAQREEPIED